MIFKEDISIFHDLVHSWILFHSGSFELVRKEPAATISSTRPELRFYWLWTWPLERPPEGNFMWWQTNPQIESSQNLALKVAETMLRSTRYHMPGKFRLAARCWRRCYHVLQVEAVLDILGILQLLQDFLLQISLTRRAVVKHQTSTCWSAFVQQVDLFCVAASRRLVKSMEGFADIWTGRNSDLTLGLHDIHHLDISLALLQQL